MNIEDMFISEECLINVAIKKMDEIGFGMLLVGENGKMSAVLTDGDIRKYLIKFHEIDTKKVKDIANFNPKTLKIEEATEKKVKQYLTDFHLKFVPIIDDEGYVYQIIFEKFRIRKKDTSNNIPIVIMAGGKGTRLAPLTNILPKPLIPVGDKAIIEHIIEQFEKWGYKKYNIIINYKKEIMKAFFLKDNYKNTNGTKIILWEEQDFLGTAGGLKMLENTIKSTFILSNCDILVKADYSRVIKMHHENKNIITMITANKELQIPYGTIEVDHLNNITTLKEKPKFNYLINTGVYIVEPEVLGMIEEGTYINFTDIIQLCLDKGMKVGNYEIPESAWMDMGELSELNKMEILMTER